MVQAWCSVFDSSSPELPPLACLLVPPAGDGVNGNEWDVLGIAELRKCVVDMVAEELTSVEASKDLVSLACVNKDFSEDARQHQAAAATSPSTRPDPMACKRKLLRKSCEQTSWST